MSIKKETERSQFVISGDILKKYIGQDEEVFIPEDIRIIGQGAFQENKTLNKVHLANVETIEENAFWLCDNLSEIIFGEALKSIGDGAFICCKTYDLNLPSSLEYVGNDAFGPYCSEVRIPKSVKEIGQSAFGGSSKIYVYDNIESHANECTSKKPNANLGLAAMYETDIYCMYACTTIVVLSSETDEIKYEVPLYMQGTPKKLWNVLTKSWGKNATFNFRALDAVFGDVKDKEDKLTYAINRMKYPVDLDDYYRDIYKEYLSKNKKKAIIRCIDNNDLFGLRQLEPIRVLQKNNFNEMLEYAVSNEKNEIAEYLQQNKAELLG